LTLILGVVSPEIVSFFRQQAWSWPSLEPAGQQRIEFLRKKKAGQLGLQVTPAHT
jgi:hypothetical protein